MAMLAEPRRKQKFSVDPRNVSWSNDDSKIGQQLMEKMGWSKGKGLGANEDGKTEHVAVNVKNDTRGVGCSKNHADNWIAHQDDFNSLLASLNQENNKNPNSDVEKVISLEQKSKTAKGRLHYQKFTKGKDLSLKSGQDLDCVFGKRKSQSGSNTPQPCSESGSEEEDKLHGIQTVTSTDSIQDYFKKKMADRKNRLENESKIAVAGNQNNMCDDDFDENAHGLGCSKQDQEPVDDFKASLKTKKLKKNKSKKSKVGSVKSDQNEAVLATIVDVLESEPSGEPIESSKKKTKRKEEEIKAEITDIACDNIDVECDANAEGTVKKKSKKRKTKKRNVNESSNVKFVIGDDVDDDGDQPRKKVKITDIACDNVEVECDANAEGPVKKKSKKRKKEKCQENDSSDVKFVIGDEVDADGDQPRKKKQTIDGNGVSSLLVQTKEVCLEKTIEASEIINIESKGDLRSRKCDKNTNKPHRKTTGFYRSSKLRRDIRRQNKRTLSGNKSNFGFPGARGNKSNFGFPRATGRFPGSPGNKSNFGFFGATGRFPGSPGNKSNFGFPGANLDSIHGYVGFL